MYWLWYFSIRHFGAELWGDAKEPLDLKKSINRTDINLDIKKIATSRMHIKYNFFEAGRCTSARNGLIIHMAWKYTIETHLNFSNVIYSISIKTNTSVSQYLAHFKYLSVDIDNAEKNQRCRPNNLFLNIIVHLGNSLDMNYIILLWNV